MVEVIPGINAKTWEEVREKIRRVEHYTKWIHLDVADGTFTKNTLWHNPLDLVGFESVAKIEVHLMESDPEERFEAWLAAPGVQFASPEAEAAYKKRVKRIIDAIQLKKPDMVPVPPFLGEFPAAYCGYTQKRPY